MEKLTFGIQIIVGIILIIIANVLSLVLHNGIFSNISWVIYGLLFIINPVYPERCRLPAQTDTCAIFGGQPET